MPTLSKTTPLALCQGFIAQHSMIPAVHFCFASACIADHIYVITDLVFILAVDGICLAGSLAHAQGRCRNNELNPFIAPQI